MCLNYILGLSQYQNFKPQCNISIKSSTQFHNPTAYYGIIFNLNTLLPVWA